MTLFLYHTWYGGELIYGPSKSMKNFARGSHCTPQYLQYFFLQTSQ